MARMDLKEQIATYLAAHRRTPSDLARDSGVPQPTIHRILSGESKEPRRTTVDRLLRVIGESPEDGATRRFFGAPSIGPYTSHQTRVKHIDTVIDAETPGDRGRTVVGTLDLRTRWIEGMFPNTDPTNLVWGHPGNSADIHGGNVLNPDDILLIDCGQCLPNQRGGIYAVEIKSTVRPTVAYFTFTLMPNGVINLATATGLQALNATETEMDVVGRVIFMWRGTLV